MINYSARNVNVMSFIISFIICILLEILCSNFLYNLDLSKTIENNYYSKNEKSQEFVNNEISESNEEGNDSISSENIEWKIIIPSISLDAIISEGTTNQIMNQYVGHFEETSKTNGNIGLAAHNRGYSVNYFENIKQLKKDDEIIYIYGEFKKTYLVERQVVIKDTDWSYLENTQENKITLITCIENQPEYRRCIQAIEKEE